MLGALRREKPGAEEQITVEVSTQLGESSIQEEDSLEVS